MKKLHAPQEAHVARLKGILAQQNCAADLSPCGLGKTVCAAELIRQLNKEAFIVAPLSTLPAWVEEVEERGLNATVVNYEKLRGGKHAAVKKVTGRWEWQLPADTMIVFDEAQKLKSIDSITSKIGISAKPYKSLLLSGSLAESPVHMRAAGYLLGLHDLRTYSKWVKERGCKVDIWGKYYFNDDDKILNALHNDIIPARGSQMTFKEMKQFLPDNQVFFEHVNFGDKGQIDKLYSEMEDELLVLAEVASNDSKGAEILTAQLRARQKAELLKVPLLAERAQDFAAEGNSVIVFLTYSASLEALSARLGGIPIIDGKHSSREELIQGFRADKFPIIGVNVAAGGAGISLHGKRPRRTLLAPSFNPIDIIQALGRAPRVGGADVVQFVLSAFGTIEIQVETSLKQKLKNIDIINNGLEKSVDVPNEISQTPSHMEENKTPSVIPPDEEHAEYNPSSLALFERCPGYLNRKDETNPIAERGTRIHKALEKDELDKLDAEKERPIAQQCKDFIDGLLTDMLPDKPDLDLRECKLHIDLTGGITTFGTCDRVFRFLKFRKAILTDYKSGYLEVTDAETNPQGWAYVIGLFQKPGFEEIDEIDLYFLVPNRDEILFHTFKRSDMAMMQLRLNTIIRRAMVADPKDFSPQQELCCYCARQATCPALASKVVLLGKKVRPSIELPVNTTVSADRPEDIPKLLHLAPIVEAWAAEVRAEALRLNLEEGVDIEGFKRQERSTPRAITSVVAAYDVVKDKVTLEDFLMICSKVSVPKLEDLYAAGAKRGEKKNARQELENRLKESDVLKTEGSIFYLREIKA